MLGESDNETSENPSRLRIAVEAQATLGHGRGVGTYTTNLLSALRALQVPGLELLELRRASRRPDERFGNFLWDQFEVSRDARRAGADVLHCAGSTAPMFPPCPTVLTVHDLIPNVYGGLSWRAGLYWKHWQRYSIRFATVVITVSESTRKDILRLTSIPQERVRVIPLGVSADFRPSDDESAITRVLERHGLRRPYILAVSAIQPNKNFPMLVDAFALSRRRRTLSPAHCLVVVGMTDWPDSVGLSERSREGLQETVRILGYVPHEDLLALYQAAEFLVYPSAYEGFGLCPLEAMACGAPVIASGVSSIPEVVGEAALLVTPPLTAQRFSDAISALASDEAARLQLSARGRSRAALFRWSDTARRTLDVYRRVAAGAA
ncbi:MAG: glycosyltransferase family 4 protein [Candidatus Wallbacteria bacterium]|nr:glycosyltransferase family 4 protein [Candidatus Wallbacteria bacterium]